MGRLVCADIYMKYHRSQEYYDSGSWRGTKRIDGGGALMNQGIHGVDLLLYLAGDIKCVKAVSKTLVRNIEVEDTLAAVVEYKNGATGVIRATTSVYPGYPRRLELNGNKGSIALEEASIVRWDIKDNAINEDIVVQPAIAGGYSTPTAISTDGHIRQIADMLRALRSGGKPLSGIADGRRADKCESPAIYFAAAERRRAVDAILAIYRSAEEDKTVYL